MIALGVKMTAARNRGGVIRRFKSLSILIIIPDSKNIWLIGFQIITSNIYFKFGYLRNRFPFV